MSEVSGLLRQLRIQLYLEFLVYATLKLEIFSHNNLLGGIIIIPIFMDEQTEAQ